MSEQKARKPEPVNWNEVIEKTWQQLRSRYHPHPKIAELNRRLPLKGAQMQQEMLERIGRAAGVDTDHILKEIQKQNKSIRNLKRREREKITP